jgi:hypothetical protein
MLSSAAAPFLSILPPPSLSSPPLLVVSFPRFPFPTRVSPQAPSGNPALNPRVSTTFPRLNSLAALPPRHLQLASVPLATRQVGSSKGRVDAQALIMHNRCTQSIHCRSHSRTIHKFRVFPPVPGCSKGIDKNQNGPRDTGPSKSFHPV